MPPPFLADSDLTVYCGDALAVLPELEAGSVQAVVTSPPYLDARREYGTPGPREWRGIFSELRRVVAPAGPAVFNVGRLWRDGVESDWWMRLIRYARRGGWQHLDTLVWIKPNGNPIHGRFLANSHEYALVFGGRETLLNEDAVRTEYDAESLARYTRRYRNGGGVKGEVREQDGREAHALGARARSFFICYAGSEKGNPHPAPMALEFAEHLVLLAAWPGGVILDPFMGSGTTALAARLHGRRSVGVEKSEDYCRLIQERTQQLSLLAGEE